MNYIVTEINNCVLEAEELINHFGEKITLHGFIYKIRKMSGFEFVIIRTKRKLVQCVYIPEKANFGSDILIEGACVEIVGRVIVDERSRSGFEIQLTDITVFSTPFEEFPVVINNKKMDMGIDTLLNIRPLTLRNEKERAIFKIQEGLVRSFRDFLYKNKFTEIHTPKIVFAGAEGGANIFELDYFGKQAFLAQSPQFYKQAMVSVYERVFEVGAVYRAEKHDTSRHINEYISMDIEMGFIKSFEEICQLQTKLLQEAFEFLRSEYVYELELLNVPIEAYLEGIKRIPIIKFMEAKSLIENEYGRKCADYYDFEPEEEQLLCDYVKKNCGSSFVFVTHYPTEKRPFYAMDDPHDARYTLSFDLLFNGLEVTTGGQRIHSYADQVEKMLKREMTIEDFDSYLMLHKYGAPPHGGFGMGLERLTARLLNLNNVRYASLFPRDLNRLTP